jgi:hypothetical protein
VPGVTVIVCDRLDASPARFVVVVVRVFTPSSTVSSVRDRDALVPSRKLRVRRLDADPSSRSRSRERVLPRLVPSPKVRLDDAS